MTRKHTSKSEKAGSAEKTIKIEIEDNGIGMDEEELEAAADIFWRSSDPYNRHSEGSGIGLSIVKSIIESNNGKLWISSKKGIGTKISIQLPQ